MLTRRVIITLTLNGGSLYRTKKFRPDRLYTMNFVDMELADEIVILDVTRLADSDGGVRSGDGRRDFLGRLHDFAENLFLPLSVGGHVDNSDYALDLLRLHGADKIVVNSEAFRRPEFITELAERFGSQSVVVSIDSKDDEVFIEQGTKATGIKPEDWAYEAQERGAGEIYLMDIERDGSLQGYNIPLVQHVAARVSIPVIISGGCGGWKHLHEGFSAGADACSTSNIFHFTTTSLNAAKQYLAEKGHEVRL